MKELSKEEELYVFGKALSSPIRIGIIKLLIEQDGQNYNELAKQLSISGSAITAHINQLEKAGIIEVGSAAGIRGTQKKCYIKEHRFLLDFQREHKNHNTIAIEIPVGSYCDYETKSTCGMATTDKVIGAFDNPRYFDDPERIYAGIVWITEGYLDYRLPNYIEKNQKVEELQITQEISSEAPGFSENWPSEIHFSINGINLGNWTSPGDFGLHTGLYSPDWWVYGKNQYGMLKALVINDHGCYMDGQPISSVTIDDLNIVSGSEIRYRISAPDKGPERGGLTIFGRGFGNYNQAIKIQMKISSDK